MKKRIVACILALTMLLTDVTLVAAGGNHWQGSSFQNTIDWLFAHSSEIGYTEIASVAADMKQDYSLLRECFADDETSTGLIHILDAYVRARAASNAGDGSLIDASVGDSHRKLWEYFRESVRPYGGSVLKVQPVLQVRDIREAEGMITLSVYEWVYMTYEMGGRKDISACGFEHQMVCRAGETGWTLVQDSWDMGECGSVRSGESETTEDASINDNGNSREDQTVENIPDGNSGSLTNESGTPEETGTADNNQDLNADGSSDGETIPEGNDEDPEGTSQGSGDLSEGNESSDDDVTGENSEQNSNSAEDGDKTSETNGEGNMVSGEEDTQDAVAGDDTPVNSDDPAGETGAEEENVPDDSAASGETAADSDTYSEDLTDIFPDDRSDDSLFPELDVPEKTESDSLFDTAQMTLSFFKPLTAMFSLQTLNYTYSYKDAVAYADKYAMSYNPAYPDLNSVGGDCANFVSQCLYAGGLPMTDKWFYRNGSRSGSWAIANDLFNYVSTYCGTAVVDTDPGKIVSHVTAGNPVFYYGYDSGRKQYRYRHAAICVGVNASGVPVVDAHNGNHLRAVWTLGGTSYWGSGSKFAVVRINGNSSNSSTEVPALPPEEPDDGELWVVTASSGLKLRQDAGTSFESIGAIPKNKQISIVEKKTIGEQIWGKTTYNGLTGWCCLIYSSGVSYATYVNGSTSIVTATGIKLDKTTATISGIGHTLKLNATVTPSGASPNLSWTSSDLSVATVENGLVTARANGTVVITAHTTDGSNKSASCIVSIANTPVTAIKLSKTSVSLKKAGSTATLTVSYTPSTVKPGVTWKSSDTSVVTVDSNGKLKAVKEGSAKITATAKDGFSASATCTVYVGRYTIKYNLNGGKNNSKNKTYYYSSSGRTLYTPTRSGYVFDGWYTKKNLTGKITKIAKGKTTNYTLYAKWVQLAKPVISKMTRTGSGKIRVYVKSKIAGATGYQVQCATDTRFTKGAKTKKSTSMSPTITGLKKKTRYYVRVRAYTKLSTGKYVYGSYSSYHYITMS